MGSNHCGLESAGVAYAPRTGDLDVCPWEQHSEAEGPACRRAQIETALCFA